MLNVTFLAVLPYVWGDLKSAARTAKGFQTPRALQTLLGMWHLILSAIRRWGKI